MATQEHYIWAGGHILLLLSSLRYLLAWAFFRKINAYVWWYKAAYTGALVSYAIVCRKAYFQPNSNQSGAAIGRRALADENVQYLLLAIFWWISKPVPVSLIPYATFSLFHTLTFLRSNILPHFFPPTAPATAGQPAQQHAFLKRLQGWIKANYDPAMKVVAYAEIVILIRVVFGALLWRNSLLTPIIYAHFLRARFYQSQFTQRAFSHVNAVIEGYVKKPGNPPVLISTYDKLQALLTRWAGQVLQPQQPAGGNGNGNGARRQ